jgi:sterol desaturase/sphingolipid hydroxylase (fatty acid hydroxylase superfamily)
VWAIPIFLITLIVEAIAQRRAAKRRGPTPGTYEAKDTATSLTMGLLSMVIPLVLPKVLRPLTPGRGRLGRALVALAGVATVTSVVADRAVATSNTAPARRVSKWSGLVATAAGLVATSTWWASKTSAEHLWSKRRFTISSPLAQFLVALVGWDFAYYLNHKLMHERRFLWAIHVVHHSSERYNLSTALRQPLFDAFGTFVPYGFVSYFGVSPASVLYSRGVNLLYQYWIHTELITSLGRAERVLNSPSAHRVHHGVNREYLDKNHAGIFITFDRLFKTYEPEVAPVVYGLTKNISTFNPVNVALHEYRAMARDVAHATSWRERLGYLVAHPGWKPGAPHRQDLMSSATM